MTYIKRPAKMVLFFNLVIFELDQSIVTGSKPTA